MRVVLIVLFVLLAGPAARAELPEGLDGYWRGSVLDEGAELPVDLRLRNSRDGFEMAITLPRTTPLKASMVPAAAPDVFQEAASGGLLGFFNGDDDRSVLDGRPLIWARRTEGGIIAYRLQIAQDGGSELLRIALTPRAEALEVMLERRLDGVRQPDLHGSLDRRE